LKNKYTIPVLFGLVVFLLISMIALSVQVLNPKKLEIVYVDNIELFNGFNMSKDLAKINNQKITGQKKKLDSLYAIYTIFKEQKNEEKQLELERQLRKEDQELRKINEHFSKEVSQQVWNRLNQYIKEYGQQNELKIILGTQGNGNIMYTEEGINITTEVLHYVNTKYEGN